jgi:hypothetical protein
LPRFMAVHTLPLTEAEAKKQAENMPKFPAGFAWKQTYCDFAGHKFFCDWEAPSKEALAQVFKAQNMPFEAIYPVRLFDVAKAKFVP